MNDLATIIKNNSPKVVKQSQTAARRANSMGRDEAVCSGRLAETPPKRAATREYLRKHGRP